MEMSGIRATICNAGQARAHRCHGFRSFGARDLEIDILEVTDDSGADVPISKEERAALVTAAAQYLSQ